MKNKVDLFLQLENLFPGDEIAVPKQVIEELEKLVDKTRKIKDRQAVEISLKMLKSNTYSSPDLKTNDVDKGIFNYLKNSDKSVLGTMDRELKESIKKNKLNVKFLRIKSKKKIEIA